MWRCSVQFSEDFKHHGFPPLYRLLVFGRLGTDINSGGIDDIHPAERVSGCLDSRDEHTPCLCPTTSEGELPPPPFLAIKTVQSGQEIKKNLHFPTSKRCDCRECATFWQPLTGALPEIPVKFILEQHVLHVPKYGYTYF